MDTQAHLDTAASPLVSLPTGGTTLPDGVAPALNTEQASIYTGLATATLEGLRCRGNGPRFVRYGRKAVRYLMRDLDEWMAARTVGSTSEPIAA